MNEVHYSSINRFREAMGLKPIVRKVVKCLCCQHEFESRDYPKQRLCSNCRYCEDSPDYVLPNID